MPVSPRSGRTYPRWLPLPAAALVLLQLGGMLHLAAAPHGVCWEHGVVVDLDAAPAAGESVAAPAGLAPARVPLVRSDGHPHCPALCLLRPARLEVGGATPVSGCAPRTPTVAAPEQLPSPAGWALRHAPKQSPPV